MGLLKNFDTKMGVSGNYINCTVQLIGKTRLMIQCNFRKDDATRQLAGAIPLNAQMNGSDTSRITGFHTLYECTYDLTSADNIFKQAYSYLKTLPEFTGATDA